MNENSCVIIIFSKSKIALNLIPSNSALKDILSMDNACGAGVGGSGHPGHGEQVVHNGQAWHGEGVGCGQLQSTGLGVGHLEQSCN